MKKTKEIKAKDETQVRVFLPLHRELHKELKIRCLIEGTHVQDVLSDLVKNYMKDYKVPTERS